MHSYCCHGNLTSLIPAVEHCSPSTMPHGYSLPLTLWPRASTTVLLPITAKGVLSCMTEQRHIGPVAVICQPSKGTRSGSLVISNKAHCPVPNGHVKFSCFMLKLIQYCVSPFWQWSNGNDPKHTLFLKTTLCDATEDGRLHCSYTIFYMLKIYARTGQ